MRLFRVSSLYALICGLAWGMMATAAPYKVEYLNKSDHPINVVIQDYTAFSGLDKLVHTPLKKDATPVVTVNSNSFTSMSQPSFSLRIFDTAPNSNRSAIVRIHLLEVGQFSGKDTFLPNGGMCHFVGPGTEGDVDTRISSGQSDIDGQGSPKAAVKELSIYQCVLVDSTVPGFVTVTPQWVDNADGGGTFSINVH